MAGVTTGINSLALFGPRRRQLTVTSEATRRLLVTGIAQIGFPVHLHIGKRGEAGNIFERCNCLNDCAFLLLLNLWVIVLVEASNCIHSLDRHIEAGTNRVQSFDPLVFDVRQTAIYLTLR